MTSSAAALEAHVRPHIYKITSEAGVPLGTGFAVGGAILTCAHVIAACTRDDLRVGGVRVRSLVSGSQTDAAVLTLEAAPGGLAITSDRPDEVLTGGFPLAPGLSGPVLSASSIGGSTDIIYDGHGRSYSATNVWTLVAGLVAPGHSGGPVIDKLSGAVAGMIVANFGQAGGSSGPSGFVLPMASILEDVSLREHLTRAERETPRFGESPNGHGAIEWCRKATSAEIDRMTVERLYDQSRTIRRDAIFAELERFLASGAPVWAIVDRSGVGKSTALASIADGRRDRPVLFLRAMEIDDPAGLQTMVQNKLGSVRPLYATGLPLLKSIAASSDHEPLVIIDGLNEAALSIAQMRDRWLPQTFRDAIGCKLIISCRPEAWNSLVGQTQTAWFHQSDGDLEANGAGFRIGEFTQREHRAFIAQRFKEIPAIVRAIKNPLLLQIAAELKTELDGPFSQWGLFERWIQRDCARAADLVTGLSARSVEDTLQRAAADCLAAGERTVTRSAAITRESAFEALLRQHLIIEEGQRFGFRYDELFEHLAARALSVSELQCSAAGWFHSGIEISWDIVAAFARRVAYEEDLLGIEMLWEMVESLEDISGRNVVRIIAALPVSIAREPVALALIERSASHGLWGFSLRDAELTSTGWRPEFARSVLRLAVLSASGYDFRENDLAETMRFARNQGQFEIQGFKPYVADLLQRDRAAMLSELQAWHIDEEQLGVLWGDRTRESTVSSWTSCCFVFCSEFLTDAELATVPVPRKTYIVFQGLARQDPVRFLRVAHQILNDRSSEPRRLRAIISVLYDVADDIGDEFSNVYASLACAAGLRRFQDLDDDSFQNRVLAWCASEPVHQAQAWNLMVELAENGRAESAVLQAFLPRRPNDVLAIVKRLPQGFSTQTGDLTLDLAKSSFSTHEPLANETGALRLRILHDYIAQNGPTKSACGIIEDLLYALTPLQIEQLGLFDLTLDVIRTTIEAKVLAYFAGDQNRTKSGDELAVADRLALAMARDAIDEDTVTLVLYLRLMRAKSEFDKPELELIRDISTQTASRFGSAPLCRTLKSASGFFHALSLHSLQEICRAVRGDVQDATLDSAIASILRQHGLGDD